jgi:hypothetical protein
VTERIGLRDAAAGPANHQCDLAFVIELFGFARPQDRRQMRAERTGRAVEHAGIFRHFLIAVIGVAVAVIDADAQNFFGRLHRRQPFHFRRRKIGAHAAQSRARNVEAIVAQEVEHAIEARRQPGLEIDHAQPDA